MINLKYFFHRLQDVKFTDLIQVFPMMIGLGGSFFYKNKYKNVWLICEDRKEARDNGYWFFKQMVKFHPEQKCVYAIDRGSSDFDKVNSLGEVIKYGSIKHWMIYFCCEYNISSQKGGKPNSPLCAFIELNGLHKNNSVFLQHGVIINDLRWLYADRSRFIKFVTSAKPEYDFVKETFGYDEDVVCLTGMPRFDGLHDFKKVKNRILIMPSWRSWFTEKSSMQGELNSDFLGSRYLVGWKIFLESARLNELIKEYNLEVLFYPHRNLQFHLHDFISQINTTVKIVSWKDYDIQELMKSSEMMITDYSSVFFDMTYMKKPVIFYQFDIEDFRKAHYGKGYFDYFNNPFGKSFESSEEVINELEKNIKNDYALDESFYNEHKAYFPYDDTNNSERVFEIIKSINKRGSEL